MVFMFGTLIVLQLLLQLILGLFAEAFEFHQPVLVDGIEQFAYRLGAQPLPDRHDLFGAKALDVEHFLDAVRCLGFVFFQCLHLPVFHQFPDFAADGLAHPLDGGDLGLFHFRQRLVEGAQRAVCILVGTNLEGVLPVQFHEAAQQLELFGDLFIGHKTGD